MPTKLLYLNDSYLKQAKAKVRSVKSDGQNTVVVLNQTIFYPQGGGQLGDQGEIVGEQGNLKVSEVAYNKGAIQHKGKLTGSLSKGDLVSIKLDWDRRYHHMQYHTAGHLVDEAVKLTLPEFHGIQASHGISSQFYIKYEGFLDESYRDHIQDQLNKLIEQDLPITARLVSKTELDNENIFLPFKLPDNKPLRLIQIGDLPPVPDGGTQLQSTGECWPTTIADFEYDSGNTLIHYHTQARLETQLQTPKKHEQTQSQEISLNKFIDSLSELEKSSFSLEPSEDNRAKVLGKSGQLNKVAGLIRSLSTEDKKAAGIELNKIKTKLEKHFSQKTRDVQKEWVDVTQPGTPPPVGHLHLISEAIIEIESIFSRLGFVRRRYPEIETDWYYAEGLNIPKDHPARDDQETFYLSADLVLTAHTSNGQLREMEYMKKPPIKMINIGKTYRRQASNTHSPMFHQFEGLLIDVDVNMTHLVGVSNFFAKSYFGPDREIRLRPHHFQFTEPSFEVDINCHICKGTSSVDGKKCKVCKSGWLELGGAGMVHPIVLKNGGIDPEKYSGFAFGWGVERVIMMKHNVTDNLRQLYTQDLRFLQQS